MLQYIVGLCKGCKIVSKIVPRTLTTLPIVLRSQIQTLATPILRIVPPFLHLDERQCRLNHLLGLKCVPVQFITPGKKLTL